MAWLIRKKESQLVNFAFRYTYKLAFSMQKICLIGVILIILLTTATVSFSQSDGKILQLTGVVVADDGLTQMPGVHVFVPKYGRGTSTNLYGYFTLPVLVGEELVISSVGYIKQRIIIPDSPNDHLNMIFRLEVDTTYLDNIDITPYLSEKMFKEAILAMELPDQGKIIGGRLDGAALSSMLGSVPYDASLNARYYFDQQFYYQQDNFGPRTNPFLNPFNWSKFIKSLKKK